MRTGRLGVVVVACVALTSASGCASDAKTPKPARTVKIAPALGSETFGTIVGAAQMAARTTHAAMKVESGGQTFTAVADIVLRPGGNLTSALVDFGKITPDKLKLRLVDNLLYVNPGSASDDEFAGVPYPLTKDFAAFKPYVVILGQLDPVALISIFAASPTSVSQTLDPVTIDGVVARTFAVEYGSGRSATKVTAYVGPDNLPRRVTSTSQGGKVTVDYTKWGGAVDIVAPAPEEMAGQD